MDCPVCYAPSSTGCAWHPVCAVCACRLETCPVCRRRLPWVPTPVPTPEDSDDEDPVASMARLLASWRPKKVSEG